MPKPQSSAAVLRPVRNQLLPHQYKFGPIEHRPTGTLAAYEHNPRKHPEKQIVKLMASISEFGFAMPVLVDCAGVIIAGHARVAAARRLGLPEVPVIIADQWSKAQVRAYRLADNRLGELATWDLEVLAVELAAIVEFDETPVELLGWEAGEIEMILAPNATERLADRADECPDFPATPVSMPGDLWQLGQHRLLCGSSRVSGNWPGLMGGTMAAMAFSSWPPGVTGVGEARGLAAAEPAERAKSPGKTPTPGSAGTLTAAIKAMTAQLKPGGVLMLATDWQHSREVLGAIDSNRLSLLHMCVRTKAGGELGPLYRSAHELIWIAKKGDAPHANNVEQDHKGRYRTDVWDYAASASDRQPSSAAPAERFAAKPVSLVEDAIKDVTNSGEIVLDAFVGSGATILAAERASRSAYGTEVDPRLVDVAIARWEAMTGKPALHAQSGESFAAVASCRGVHVDELARAKPAKQR